VGKTRIKTSVFSVVKIGRGGAKRQLTKGLKLLIILVEEV